MLLKFRIAGQRIDVYLSKESALLDYLKSGAAARRCPLSEYARHLIALGVSKEKELTLSAKTVTEVQKHG